jgi:hypothetical protein
LDFRKQDAVQSKSGRIGLFPAFAAFPAESAQSFRFLEKLTICGTRQRHPPESLP